MSKLTVGVWIYSINLSFSVDFRKLTTCSLVAVFYGVAADWVLQGAFPLAQGEVVLSRGLGCK